MKLVGVVDDVDTLRQYRVPDAIQPRDQDGTVKLAESGLGRSRGGRLNGRDDDRSRPDLRRLSLPRSHQRACGPATASE